MKNPYSKDSDEIDLDNIPRSPSPGLETVKAWGDELEIARAERDAWKRRALAAERDRDVWKQARVETESRLDEARLHLANAKRMYAGELEFVLEQRDGARAEVARLREALDMVEREAIAANGGVSSKQRTDRPLRIEVFAGPFEVMMPSDGEFHLVGGMTFTRWSDGLVCIRQWKREPDGWHFMDTDEHR